MTVVDNNNNNNSNNGSSSPCGFIKQLLRGRWFMVFASFLIMASSGSNYIFGVYSSALKSNLDYNQSDLNLISTFKDWGSVFGIPTGLLSEVAPPSVILIIGSALNFAGYFLVYLAVLGKISRPPPLLMCAYIFIGANSCNFLNTGSYMVCVKNFPASRGMMIGMMKGMLGLSGALFTQIYYAAWGGKNPISLILLIAWLPAVTGLVFVTTMKHLESTTTHPHEKRVYFQFFAIAVSLGVILLLLTILETYFNFSSKEYIISCVVVLLVLFSPIFIAIREETLTWRKRNSPPPPEEANEDRERAVEEVEEVEVEMTNDQIIEGNVTEETRSNLTCFNKPNRGSNFGIMQALTSMDMIMLFIITFCGFGCCQATINNFGQIGGSLSYPTKTISAFISLISIWNFYGRIFTGFLSDYLLRRFHIPRTFLLVCALVVTAVADVIIALNPFSGSIYLASLLTGLSYGCQLTLVFVLISEFFGLKHFPMLANCGNLVSPFGLYTFNVQVVGRLYDNEALRQFRAINGPNKAPVEDLTCTGKECFKNSFLILAGANLFGALVAFVLHLRTRRFYKELSS
ncbi:uncharacterized protein LOC124935637 [Impatiens glandulifera]|uniref:uncharacterized protein LOC124935637 n=1 Tax=Impatiens glandulifera TaxID=253017 RepID=UPI001FB08F88|nr:uncharacterized protein LOC124935637 [Impatiens glandulifera]